jgi:hypothetical protein
VSVGLHRLLELNPLDTLRSGDSWSCSSLQLALSGPPRDEAAHFMRRIVEAATTWALGEFGLDRFGGSRHASLRGAGATRRRSSPRAGSGDEGAKPWCVAYRDLLGAATGGRDGVLFAGAVGGKDASPGRTGVKRLYRMAPNRRGSSKAGQPWRRSTTHDEKSRTIPRPRQPSPSGRSTSDCRIRSHIVVGVRPASCTARGVSPSGNKRMLAMTKTTPAASRISRAREVGPSSRIGCTYCDRLHEPPQDQVVRGLYAVPVRSTGDPLVDPNSPWSSNHAERMNQVPHRKQGDS